MEFSMRREDADFEMTTVVVRAMRTSTWYPRKEDELRDHMSRFNSMVVASDCGFALHNPIS
ncbi:hypothetical protein ACU8KH_05657 [Lachancea thermotolerans]